MPKPNSTFTLIEIRSYVRSHRLNKPEIRLGMKKAELIAGLKKHGHWDHKADARISLRKGGEKPPMVKKKKTQPKKKKEAPKPKETPTGQKNLQELLRLGDLSSKIQKAVKKTMPSKGKMLKAYKIIGEETKKLHAKKGGESGDAFTHLVRYKSGKKKGQVRHTGQSWTEMAAEREWKESRVKKMARRFNMPYVDKYDNWDTLFREKYGNMEANELLNLGL